MGELDSRTLPKAGMGRRTEIALTAGLLLGLLVLNSLAIFGLFTSRGNFVIWDLHPPLMAARAVLKGIDPYSPEVTESIQLLDYGRVAQQGEDAQAFAYPAYLAFLFIPIAVLPLSWAQAVWLSLLETAIIISVVAGIESWSWPESRLGKVGIVLWAMALYPFAWAFILGQVSLLVCGMLAIGFWSIRTGKDRIAGLLLGLTIIKPNLVFLLIPGLLIWAYIRGRGGLWRWMAGTMLVLVALPMPFTPDWIMSFMHRLGEYSSYSPFSPPAYLVGRWFPAGMQNATTMGLAALVLSLVVLSWWEAARAAGRAALIWAFGTSLLGAVWIAPQTSIVNQVVLLIPMIGVMAVLWERGRLGRVLGVCLLLFWLAVFWGLVQTAPISAAEPRYPVEHRVLAPVLPLTVGIMWLVLRRLILRRLGGE